MEECNAMSEDPTNKRLNWELLEHKSVGGYSTGGLSRLKVPCGWLVRDVFRSGDGVKLNTFYMPDPTHEWLDKEQA